MSGQEGGEEPVEDAGSAEVVPAVPAAGGDDQHFSGGGGSEASAPPSTGKNLSPIRERRIIKVPEPPPDLEPGLPVARFMEPRAYAMFLGLNLKGSKKDQTLFTVLRSVFLSPLCLWPRLHC